MHRIFLQIFCNILGFLSYDVTFYVRIWMVPMQQYPPFLASQRARYMRRFIKGHYKESCQIWPRINASEQLSNSNRDVLFIHLLCSSTSFYSSFINLLQNRQVFFLT